MDFAGQETSRKLIFIEVKSRQNFFNIQIFSKLSETCYISANGDFDGKRTHFYNSLNTNIFGTKNPKTGHSVQ